MEMTHSVEQVQSIYISYYGRPGDPVGVCYWVNRLEGNQGDLSAILDAFGNSSEYIARYGELDDATLINLFYQNTYGRNADDAGLAFYLGKLESGEFTLASIAKNIWDGTSGTDSSIVADKLLVADHFTNQVSRQFKDYGLNDIDDAVGLLRQLSNYETTTTEAIQHAINVVSEMPDVSVMEQLSRQPSEFEQYFLSLVNSARSDPIAEAARLGVDITEDIEEGVISREGMQPLGFDDSLMQVATDHSAWMQQHGLLMHDELGRPFDGGFYFEDRVSIAGYSYADVAQNVAYAGLSSGDGALLSFEQKIKAVKASYEQLFSGTDSISRSMMLHENHSDTGVGIVNGAFQLNDSLLLTHLAAEPNQALSEGGIPTLLGVVYSDRDSDGFYTPGEGEGDARIFICGKDGEAYRVDVMDEGGFQVDLEPGTYDVHFYLNDSEYFVDDLVIDQSNVSLDWMLI